MDERIKQLAEQAGFDVEDRTNEIWFDEGWYTSIVERFAELVRQDEAKACAEHYVAIMRDAVTQARLAEREACAKLAEDEHKLRLAETIRARGNT